MAPIPPALPRAWHEALTAAHGPPRTIAPPAPGGGFAALRAVRCAPWLLCAGVSPAGLDDFFRLRLAQILLNAPPCEALSVLLLHGPATCAGGFAARFRSGWPFRRAIFAAPAAAAAGYAEALGVAVAALEDPLPNPLRSAAQPGQKIAAQIQILWPRCGSTTAFENQIEDLLSAGHFTLRVFHAPHHRPGPTLAALAARWIPENTIQISAHLNLLAAAAPGHVDCADLPWPAYLTAAAATPIGDAEARAALLRADRAVVNHLEPMGLALRVSPGARLLLDVHDDRARSEAAFLADQGTAPEEIARKTAETESVQQALWATADICTHVNAEEGRHVAAHAPRFALILPRPYIAVRPPTAAQRWDGLLVGDAHPFNLAGIDWFLTQIRPRPGIAALRLAVAGRAGLARRAALEDAGIAVLGFVADLEAVRAESRVMLAPEQDGSGVAVKVLGALAAGQPLVATAAALRGLPDAVTRLLPGAVDADGFAADLLGVLADEDALAARRAAVAEASRHLRSGPGYADCLAQVPPPDAARIATRQAAFDALTAPAVPGPPGFLPAAALRVGISLAAGAPAEGIGLGLWHDGETWGRWSDGAEASLDLLLDRPVAGRMLRLDLRARPDGAFGLRVTVNGVALGERRIAGDGWQEWTLPEAAIAGRTRLRVTLATDTAFEAARFTPEDDRILGFALAGLA
ncbi:MAG: glycosyltransferase family 4 protein, partial [Rhodospirillales bacterium]|nr:glycosyltransferase family 4 protein [Rhodospirillales bacterium]